MPFQRLFRWTNIFKDSPITLKMPPPSLSLALPCKHWVPLDDATTIGQTCKNGVRTYSYTTLSVARNIPFNKFIKKYNSYKEILINTYKEIQFTLYLFVS